MLIGCEFTYVAQIPTPVIFQVQPLEDPHISVTGGKWTSEPLIGVRGYTDLYGNPCVRAVLPDGRPPSRSRAAAEAPAATEEVDPDAPERLPDDLPDHPLIYTLPSRYCLPDVLGNEAWSRFGTLPPRYRRVQAGCENVNQHLTLQRGGSAGP